MGAWGQTFTVSGRVTDAATGEYALGANVLDVKKGKGVSTNIYGFYSITLPQRPSELMCSFVGYAAQTKSFGGTQDVVWNIELVRPVGRSRCC